MTIPETVRPRRPTRETVGWAAGVMLVLLVVGVALLALRTAEGANRQLAQDKAAESTAIGALSTALDQTRTQLQQHGVVPKAPPPSTIIQSVPGAQGAVGPAGATGPQGVAGSPGPIGPTGPAGAVGKTGATGPTGATGQTGPAGVAGPAGPQGDPGPAGAQGPAGASGQPPAGWTYTDATGATYDCERVSNFDPAAPRYTCTPTNTGGTPAPGPSPTPSQSATAGPGQAKPKPKATTIVSTGPR